MNAFTTLSLTVFTQWNFVADFLQAKCDWTQKTAVLRIWDPFWGLRFSYNFIWKRVVDFLLVLIELFARCYRWGATSEYRLKVGDFAPTGQRDQKFQAEEVASSNHSSSQKTRLNGLSYCIKNWTDFSSFLSQITRLTDGQTAFSWLDRVLHAVAMHAAW